MIFLSTGNYLTTCGLTPEVRSYEPEPWEQARRERLERHAQQRDQIAGIVVYYGDWNETASTPTKADAWPQDIDESQTTIFPDEYDQRPPSDWELLQWNQTSQQWNDTPLSQWATEANTWDGINPIPPEDEPVFYNN